MDEQVKTSAGQGFGIASLILGIIALLVALIPCIGLFALIPGIIAIILAIIGLSQASKANGAKGVIIAGLIISILGTTLAGIWLMFFSAGGALLKEISDKPDFENVLEEIIQDISGEIEGKESIEITIGDEEVREEDLEQKLEEMEKADSLDAGTQDYDETEAGDSIEDSGN